MARHSRHSKKRSYNRNRRTSRKMRGGVGEEDRQELLDLGFKPEDIDYLFQHNPRMSVEIFRNAIDPPTSSPFYNEKQTAEEMMEGIRKNNESIYESEAFETPPKPSKRPRLEENSYVSDDNVSNSYVSDMNATPNNLSRSFGGKRKSKRRTSIKKRKTRKNRRQQGGKGFTTQEEISPLAYVDQREISEANMPRP